MTRFRHRAGERGVALILAILAIFILTGLGLALMYVTGTEQILASNEVSAAKGFHAADSGIQWTASQLAKSGSTLLTQTFPTTFQLPDNLASENPASPNMIISIQKPRVLGRRQAAGAQLNSQNATFYYQCNIVSSVSDSVLSITKTIQADVEVGPLPGIPPCAIN